jgi:hypothetical protein
MTTETRMEVSTGNPAILRLCAFGPEALRRRLSTVLPLRSDIE